VSVITYVQQLKRTQKLWKERTDMCKDGERLLDRQRFQFPQQWTYAEQVEGEWSSFESVLARRDADIMKKMAPLRDKVLAEDVNMERKTTDVLGEWDRAKPTDVRVCVGLFSLMFFRELNVRLWHYVS
jgi:dynein heavy chain 1